MKDHEIHQVMLEMVGVRVEAADEHFIYVINEHGVRDKIECNDDAVKQYVFN